MSEVRPYYDFLLSVAGLGREKFLSRITDPYLCFTDLPGLAEQQQQEAVLTRPFRTLREADSTPPVPSKLLERGLKGDLGIVGVIPVRKEAGSNAFTMMITLGRAPNNDLVIPDRRVSKFHLYFQHGPRGWTLTDANSTNGTAIDGLELEPRATVALHSGIELELSGTVRAVFLEPPALYELVVETCWDTPQELSSSSSSAG